MNARDMSDVPRDLPFNWILTGKYALASLKVT